MLFVLGVMACLCSPAFSAIVSYDTPVSWEANVDSIVTDNFDSNGPGTAIYYGGGYTNPGVFTLSVSPGGTLYNYYMPGSPYYDYGSKGIMRGPDNDNGTAFITVTMLANATAFAIELMSAPDGLPISVTINNDMAETYNVSTSAQAGPRIHRLHQRRSDHHGNAFLCCRHHRRVRQSVVGYGQRRRSGPRSGSDARSFDSPALRERLAGRRISAPAPSRLINLPLLSPFRESPAGALRVARFFLHPRLMLLSTP